MSFLFPIDLLCFDKQSLFHKVFELVHLCQERLSVQMCVYLFTF